MDRSGLDVLNRTLSGNGTGRRSLLMGGLLTAIALSRGAETKAKKRKRKLKSLWAVVDSDGSLASARGATLAKKLQGNGAYEVTFSQDVSQCAKITQIPYTFAWCGLCHCRIDERHRPYFRHECEPRGGQ